jgi:4-hydroxy-2-oxoheptanedioate aldolase
MFRNPNKVREKLEKGEPVIGTVMYSWSPTVMEVAGIAGLDFVRIDCEHSWRQDGMADHLIRAAALSGVVPIMRIDRGSPYLPMKAFEIGAGGIIAVDIDTPEDAEAVVKQSKFPPIGTRGYSGQCWSGGWGAKAGKEWIEWSDRELLVGLMIESTDAIKNVEEIMAVEGVDFVLYGPADYSMSLGLRYPQKNHPIIKEGLTKTITAAQKYKKAVCCGVGTDLEQIKKYKEMGLTMFELGSDIAVLKSVWNKLGTNITELD